MSDKIAISDLKTIANKYGLDHVICFATKGKQQYVATYGHTVEACDQAAQFGDKLKDGLGWPESLHALPSRVKTLLARAEAAERELREAKIMLDDVCRWKLTDDEMDLWEGDCGAAWNFIEGGDPKENEMSYCPKCGRKLEQVLPEPPEAEND